MTVENVYAVSVLASGFRTKVSIYQCRIQIKPKWGRSSNELQHFTQCAERLHCILFVANLSPTSFKEKLLRVTFFMLLIYFSIQLSIKLCVLRISVSSDFHLIGLQLHQVVISQGKCSGGSCFTIVG